MKTMVILEDVGMSKMTPKKFVEWLNPAAKAIDVSPVFIMAQAALESGWGGSTIGKYNIFGITRGGWPEDKCLLVTTTEYFKTKGVKFNSPECVISIKYVPEKKLYRYVCRRLFRNYGSLSEALNDHAKVLRASFPDAWPYRMSPEVFVEKIQSGKKKYATSPTYVQTMKKMFAMIRKEQKEVKG